MVFKRFKWEVLIRISLISVTIWRTEQWTRQELTSVSGHAPCPLGNAFCNSGSILSHMEGLPRQNAEPGAHLHVTDSERQSVQIVNLRGGGDERCKSSGSERSSVVSGLGHCGYLHPRSQCCGIPSLNPSLPLDVVILTHAIYPP